MKNRNLFADVDLQLFSNHVNVTTDNTAGTNDLTPEMKTFYDMVLIDEASPNLVHDQFGQKKPIPKNGGKTIEFRKFSSLAKAMTALTEGVTPDGKTLNVSSITATVAQYGDYITQSDMLELTAVDNTIIEASKLLGRQAGLTLDTVTRNILQSGTNVSYASKWSGDTEVEVSSRAALDKTATLKVDTVEKAVVKMRANNVPAINGDYVCIIHPYVAYDLRRDPEWIDAHKYSSPDELYTGEIGKIAGVRFVVSSEAKIYYGEDLASNSRTLTVNGASSGTTVTFDGGTVAGSSLVGRYVIIGGEKRRVTANTASTLTIDSALSVSDNAVIYPGEGAGDGSSVFGCLFIGQGAYGVTEVTGGGLQMIIKQKGSAGTADPLDQRSSVGWKAARTAEILAQENLIRLECCSKYTDISAN
ncbi:MAG: N4-gp56 family major capsid protein [Clostridia bacterium]|nr:N4-gp56 family major capsid protein [Clostridia bacterium]